MNLIIRPEGKSVTLLEEKLKNKYDEFEFRLGKLNNIGFDPDVGEKRFNILFKSLKNNSKYTYKHEISTVNIYDSYIRSITTNSNTIYQKKLKTNIDFKFFFFDVRATIATETPTIKPKTQIKEIRERDRHSFITDDYTVDMTIISKKFYEIEIEYKSSNLRTAIVALKEIANIIFAISFMTNLNDYIDIIDKWKRWFNSNDWKVIENRPVDMTFSRILKIKENYCVTNKLDGKLKRLIITKNREQDVNIVYLVDVRGPQENNVESIIAIKINSSIIDDIVLEGEYWNTEFHIFDILYYSKDKNILSKKFNERLSIIKGIDLSFIKELKILIKRFYFEDISKNTLKLLKSEPEFIDNNDGFIYTPVNKSYYQDLNFPLIKYKFLNKLSFDAHLRIIFNDGEVKVFVLQGYEDKIHKDYKGTEKYPISFIRYAAYKTDKYFTDLDNGVVVEFIFKYGENGLDKDREGNYIHLEFYRIRTDKIYANGFMVINDVWNSIHEPMNLFSLLNEKEVIPFDEKIRKDMSGVYKSFEVKEEIPSQDVILPVDDNIYWKDLRKFNSNFEFEFLSRYVYDKNVLDIGFGKGGTLWKYKKYRPTRIYAVEPNHDNISELRKRLSGSHKDIKGIIDIIECKGQDTEIILARTGTLSIDTVVSLLSLTFFFDNESSLNKLVKTISSTVKKGGYFIGITVDGLYVSDLLKEQKYTFKDGYIEKLYNEYTPGYGNKINFYLKNTIISQNGGPQEEWLVSFQLLQKLLELNGFRLIEYRRMNADGVSEPDKTIIELNSSFVFLRVNEIYNKERIQKIDQIKSLPVNTIKTFKSSLDDFMFVRTGVIGDGSCLIHSVIRAFIPEISILPIEQQKKEIKKIRIDMGNEMTINIWKTVGRGQISILQLNKFLSLALEKVNKKEASNIMNKLLASSKDTSDFNNMIVQYKDTLNELKIDMDMDKIIKESYDDFIRHVQSNEWIDQTLFEYIMNYFNLNIFFISDMDRKPYDIYICDSYKLNRNSIIVLNIGFSHFEILGKVEKQISQNEYDIKRIFNFKDEIIFKIYRYVCPPQ